MRVEEGHDATTNHQRRLVPSHAGLLKKGMPVQTRFTPVLVSSIPSLIPMFLLKSFSDNEPTTGQARATASIDGD